MYFLINFFNSLGTVFTEGLKNSKINESAVDFLCELDIGSPQFQKE